MGIFLNVVQENTNNLKQQVMDFTHGNMAIKKSTKCD